MQTTKRMLNNGLVAEVSALRMLLYIEAAGAKEPHIESGNEHVYWVLFSYWERIEIIFKNALVLRIEIVQEM